MFQVPIEKLEHRAVDHVAFIRGPGCIMPGAFDDEQLFSDACLSQRLVQNL
jgi:hypothetical protein